MKKAAFFLTTLAMLCISAEVSAACSTNIKTTSKKVILSELYPSPADGEEEFIEIYNSGKKKVDLAGWKLIDASGKEYVIDAEDVSSTIIKKNATMVIPQSASKIFLNNSSDSITLKQANGKKRGTTSYVDAHSGMAWALIGNTWQWSAVSKGKKNAESANTQSITTTPDDSGETGGQTSSDVLLSELLPDPEGSDATDEWIEIVNQGSTTVNLTGWQLRDSSKEYTIDNQSIAPGEQLLFSVEQTKVSLNNSGETVELADPFDTVIDTTTYTDGGTGVAWARFADGWQWTSTVTPGAANELSVPDQTQTGDDSDAEEGDATDGVSADGVISISEFRALADDESAVIEGVVTVLPGVFGEQYFYIQDQESGVQVYSYDKDFPALAVGDVVTIAGEKSQSRNETRIKTESAADIVVSGTGSVTPKVVSALDEGVEGLLVSVSGTVTEQSSTEMLIDGIVPIVIKDAVVVDTTMLEEGNAVTVVGVVGQSNDEYRVMPRGEHDVMTAEATASTTSPDTVTAASIDGGNATPSSTPLHSLNTPIAKTAATSAGVLSLAGGMAWRHPRIREWLKEKFSHHTGIAMAPTEKSSVDAIHVDAPPQHHSLFVRDAIVTHPPTPSDVSRTFFEKKSG